MTMITPSYLGETIEYSSLHACRSTLEDPNEDGAALAPSPLVSWLVRGGVETETVHGAPLMGMPVTPHERTLALVAAAPDRAADLAPYSARVAARERERERFHTSATPLGVVLDVTPELRTLLDIETGAGARALSVTAFERFAKCKFQGFAAQVLGAREGDVRADDVPDRREEGILAHEALGAAFTAVGALWKARPRDSVAIEDAARRATDAVLVREGGGLIKATLDRLRLEVLALVALAIDDEDWDFTLAEQPFGDERGWAALVVDDGVSHVALRGRIDRVDVAHDGTAVRAVDYKRRVSLPAIVDLGAGAIQVPLYALVARERLDVASASGRYVSTVKPARISAAFDERLADLVARDEAGASEASRTVLAIMSAVRSGDVAPRPSSPKWCAACGLDGACRRPRFAITGQDDE